MHLIRPFVYWIILLAVSVTGSAVAAEGTPPQPQTVRNSLGMEFVLIPSGSFLMGSPDSEPGRDPGDSERQHKVVLTRSFYIQATEVTYGQWQQLMGRGFLFRWSGPEDLPVSKVSWHDAQNFIQKLNQLGQGRYRLPSEAEWEYAARAGTSTAYFWGNASDCAGAMFANSKNKMDACQLYIRQNRLPLNGPAPVRSYAPNAWGVYDMHGNVWEWVEDRFGPYPHHPQTDPKGVDSGNSRVRRGGSWFALGHSIRSANRAFAHPASRLATTGFRVVKIVEP